MIKAAAGYLRRHPEELLRAARGAVRLRFGVPLDALRWLAARKRTRLPPRDIEMRTQPPGLRLSGTLDLVGNEVRASATVYVEQLRLDGEQLRVELRLSDVELRLIQEAADSPVATLLRSGALDLSQPGNLAAYMPRRPAVLVEAAGDRIVLDLSRHPKLAQERAVMRAVALITPVLDVQAIRTDAERLEVLLRAFPDGLGEAVTVLRGLLHHRGV